MSEKTEVQDKIFNRLVELECVVIRANGGRRGNIPFYFWRCRYRESYGVLPPILQNAYDYCEELRRSLLLNPIMLRKGLSDLPGTLPWGQSFYIECKAPGELGKWSSQEQCLFLIEAFARGAAVGVFDDVMEFELWFYRLRDNWNA